MKKVLVETVVISKNYFVVELNDTDPNEWASDSVVADEAELVQSRYLDYAIDSVREISDEELLKIKG
jgi:hypothetical protein